MRISLTVPEPRYSISVRVRFTGKADCSKESRLRNMRFKGDTDTKMMEVTRAEIEERVKVK